MSFSLPSKLLMSAGVIASASAIWHLLCIFGGPRWFMFARAPLFIIESSQQGTLLAPFGTIIVAALMFACTIFAFSAASLIRKVTLIKPALVTIAAVCTLRGLMFFPAFFTPTGLDIWQIIASVIWLYVGGCFIAGSIDYFSIGKLSSEHE